MFGEPFLCMNLHFAPLVHGFPARSRAQCCSLTHCPCTFRCDGVAIFGAAAADAGAGFTPRRFLCTGFIVAVLAAPAAPTGSACANLQLAPLEQVPLLKFQQSPALFAALPAAHNSL